MCVCVCVVYAQLPAGTLIDQLVSAGTVVRWCRSRLLLKAQFRGGTAKGAGQAHDRCSMSNVGGVDTAIILTCT